MLFSHTDNCRTAMQVANRTAQQSECHQITQMHLLVGVASAPGSASESLSACGVILTELQNRAVNCACDDEIRANDVIETAIQEVERLKHNQLDVGHVLLALVTNGDCARLLRSMDVNLDTLIEEIERRLPQPSFPLYQSLNAFSDDSRVRTLRKSIDDAQHQIESCIQKADFQNANIQLRLKDQLKQELESLLEQLWRETNP